MDKKLIAVFGVLIIIVLAVVVTNFIVACQEAQNSSSEVLEANNLAVEPEEALEVEDVSFEEELELIEEEISDQPMLLN